VSGAQLEAQALAKLTRRSASSSRRDEDDDRLPLGRVRKVNDETGIHPELTGTTVSCTNCRHTFETRSTRPSIQVEVCSQCHPAYTGEEEPSAAAAASSASNAGAPGCGLTEPLRRSGTRGPIRCSRGHAN